MAKRCGAKTRSGKPCRKWALANGRCRLHGGKSTGPPKGSRNALTHGIYAQALRDDEPEIWHEVHIEDVDDEIRLVKIQIRRTMIAMGEAIDAPDDESVGFMLQEVKRKNGEYTKPGKDGSEPLEYPGDDASDEELARFEESLDQCGDGDGELKITRTAEVNTTRKRPDYVEILNKLLGRLAQLMQAKSTKSQVDNTTEYLRNLRDVEQLKEDLEAMREQLK